MLQEIKTKILEYLFSTKVFILATATAFLYMDKVSESTWMETVLIIGGLRTASQVVMKHLDNKAAENDKPA